MYCPLEKTSQAKIDLWFYCFIQRKRNAESLHTLEYRINGGVRIIGGGGGLEIVRYNNNRGVGIIGGMPGEIENSPFLR